MSISTPIDIVCTPCACLHKRLQQCGYLTRALFIKRIVVRIKRWVLRLKASQLSAIRQILDSRSPGSLGLRGCLKLNQIVAHGFNLLADLPSLVLLPVHDQIFVLILQLVDLRPHIL